MHRRFISLRSVDMESSGLGQTFTSTSPVLTQSLSSNSSSNVTANSNVGTQSELDELVLGALQSKILVALIISKTGTLSSGMITKKAGISASSWAKIKLNMVDQGLLVCTHKRDMSDGRVIGSVEVKLTKRGVLVAQNLLLIASLLGKSPAEQIPSSPQVIAVAQNA
jgi:hydroxymethylpyrimidine/phosphomethylpyrimidine kinase